jgi:SAM-dependent methyltransferase
MDNFAAKLSQSLQQMYDRISTCESGLLHPVAIDRGLNLLKKLGYPAALLHSQPPESLARAFPLANPLTKIIELAPQSILDLGCGTALDLLFCAELMPQLKNLTGIDASKGLLDEGRKRLARFPEQKAKITLLQTDLNQLENLHLNCFDLILMNGSFNLIYDKVLFLQKISHLLAANGNILLYDFLLTESLPPGFTDEIDNWLWNIGGALREDELAGITDDAGLQVISVAELERIDPVARCEIVIAGA